MLHTTEIGQVIKGYGSSYQVKLGGEIVACRLRGKFRLDDKNEANPIAVGDRVRCSVWRDEGTIEEIMPRQSVLSRLMPGKRSVEIKHVLVANVDQVVIVVAVHKPAFKLSLIDRFLMAAESQELAAVLCFNKVDLVKKKDAAEFRRITELYRQLGYPVLVTSATQKQGIDELRQILSGKLSVLSGPSGVGKSSLLNEVETGLGLRVSSISERTQKGRHTTVSTQLIPLSSGGYVADTPGFREFGLLAMDVEDVPHLFPEFRDYLGQCQFHNCRHLAEPGCAVKAELESGKIARSRYENYQKLIEEIENKKKW